MDHSSVCYGVVRVLFVSLIPGLCQIWVLQIFSLSPAFFIFLMVFFTEKVFVLIKSNTLFSLFMTHDFCDLGNIYLPQENKDFLPFSLQKFYSYSLYVSAYDLFLVLYMT